MTLGQYIAGRLVGCGMSEQDAVGVLALVVLESACNVTASVHWSDQVGDDPGSPSGYPPQVIAVLWMAVKRRAVQWVDENCPKAWYRTLLEA